MAVAGPPARPPRCWVHPGLEVRPSPIAGHGPFARTQRAAGPVAAGEEVTSDDATGTAVPTFTLECACGTDLCRTTVTGEDWRLPALQDRYGAHWVPASRARVDRARARRAAGGGR